MNAQGLSGARPTVLSHKGGMFQLQFGNGAMGRNEVAALMGKLQKEKIVKFAAETP